MTLAERVTSPTVQRRDVWSTALVICLAVFFASRPTIDALATFEVEPDLNVTVGALLLAGSIAWMLRIALEPGFYVPAAGIAALALALAALLSSFGSPDLVFSTSMALRVVISSVIFVVCEQMAARYPRIGDVLTVAIVTGLGLTSIFAVGQIQGFVSVPPSIEIDTSRIPGPFPAPTVFATCMFIAVAIIIGLSPIWWNRVPNLIWLLGPAAGLFTYLLLVNGSRSPLGALLLAIGVMAFAQGRKLVLAPVVAAGVAVAALAPSLVSRTVELFDLSEEASQFGAESNTLLFRLRYWERILPHFDESPIIGIGIGRVEQINAEGFPPHNTSVQSVVEMGLVGLVAHYVLVISLTVALVGALRRSESLRIRSYLTCALGLGVGYLSMSYFENLLTQVVTTAPLAAFVGIALGLERNERNRLRLVDGADEIR